ncbi:helix-turn-helix DNA-binding domain protein [Microbacterium phage DizzyRudy]|nr:helix-turn-helix DNA-binding domain protein [Microbacterium phage DizzyRudy]
MSDGEVQFNDIEEFYEHLAHIGTPRHSGRYPWGSGDNPYQRHKNFLAYVDELKRSGMKEGDIVKALGLKSSSELRAMRTIAVTAKRQADIDMARKLKDKGLSNVAIGQRMEIPESSVRSLLKPTLEARANRLQETADFLKRRVDEEGYIDVGTGIEHYLGVSNTKKQVAIAMLKDEGYQVFYHKVPTHGDKETNIMVLARPDKDYNDLKADPSQIKTIAAHYDADSGEYRATLPPVNFSSKRLAIRYGDEGGADMDGVIQLRRGVDDLSLNGKAYAQVRIAVDGTHYIKGMAMYADKMPDGVDMIFNTNKKATGNKLDALKPLQRDDENPDYIDERMPFGSMVTQRTYVNSKTGKQELSPLNRVGTGDSVNEEGRWNQWSKSFSSQFLSKQSPQLAQQQLDLTFKSKADDLDEILKLTNPAVKKKLLQEFADGADASAVHLKAAGLPRTRSQVILPIPSLKDGEVYAPNFRNGERVVLVRHPHGGTFEIPELVVNNKNREALSVLKQAQDAVGINPRVAARLSGADFDGDTVLVIPNNSKKVKTTSPLAGLKNFDPQKDYAMPKGPNGEKISNGMTPKGKQKQMGDVSNLITDMTIKKASHAEIARAVRHSMVVIDAEKHNLDYKRSAKDNGILELKKKYQYDPETGSMGASTVISRSKSEARVLDRKPRSAKDGGPVDPNTGEKMWTYSNETYTKTKVNARTGAVTETVVPKPGKKSTKMAEAKDAHELSSGTPMETVYANHANRLKSLANQARKEALVIKTVKQDPVARRTYAPEVSSLLAKLNTAQKNAPLERQARLAAKATADAKKKANPQATGDQVKKAYNLGLEEARIRLGARKETVTFTDREWEAVQANAISTNVLNSLLANAKADHVKQLATPRERPVMTDAKMARAKAMLASGYTQSEIADALGVPGSTLSDALG